MIEQIGIMCTGVVAVWLSQDSREGWRCYACLFGMAGQPFWIMAAYGAEQWGILTMTMLYTYSSRARCLATTGCARRRLCRREDHERHRREDAPISARLIWRAVRQRQMRPARALSVFRRTRQLCRIVSTHAIRTGRAATTTIRETRHKKPAGSSTAG